MLVGSYGSGAQAEIHAEEIQPGWTDAIGALDIDERLGERYDLDWEEYERIHDTHNHATDTLVEAYTAPEEEFVLTGWGDMDEREYEFVA
jgi:hydroxymethylglutaryl-CoA synthase